MRVAILIPMLGKASLIHEIRPLYQLPANRVILADDFAKIDGLSERYTNLTAPQGLLSDFLLDGNPAYDLIISLKPETGRSWEVPVSLAHWVLFHGHEIVVENPDVIVWATGGLQSDSKVYPTSYEVIRKLADSSDTLHKFGSARQFFLLPEGQDIEDVQKRYPDAHVKGFWTLADAIGELADLKSARPADTPFPDNSVKTRKPGDGLSKAKPANNTANNRRLILSSGVVVSSLIIGAFAWTYYQPSFDLSEEDPPVVTATTEQTKTETPGSKTDIVQESHNQTDSSRIEQADINDLKQPYTQAAMPAEQLIDPSIHHRSKEDIYTLLSMLPEVVIPISPREQHALNGRFELMAIGFSLREIRYISCEILEYSSEFFDFTIDNSCIGTIRGRDFAFEPRMVKEYKLNRFSSEVIQYVTIRVCYDPLQVCRDVPQKIAAFIDDPAWSDYWYD